MIRRFVVPVTVDASGDADVDSPVIHGRLVSIAYVKDDFADGVDFTITNAATGETVWAETSVNAAVVKHPRAATHSQAGAAALYAAGGTAVNDRFALGGEALNIVVADGGNATSGTFHITVEG